VDSERTALYAAELAAFEGTDLERLRTFAELAAVVDEVLSAPWWPGPHVELQRTRADSRSSSTRCDSHRDDRLVRIRLAPNQLTVATVAHEMAHALAGVDVGHGPIFRAAYVDMVAMITNIDSTDRRLDLHVKQLVDACAAAGIAIGGRNWPAPPSSASGAIAL